MSRLPFSVSFVVTIILSMFAGLTLAKSRSNGLCFVFHRTNKNASTSATRQRSVVFEKKLSRFQQQLEEMRQRMGLPDNILDAAKDPAKFASMKEDNEKKAKEEEEREEKKKNRKPFIPIEEWDKMEREKAKNKGISWEERVRFDGMRHGNQDRQHDILMRNLHK